MKTIILSKGQTAFVDDEDYDYLTQWNWYLSKSGMVVRNVPIPNATSRSKRQKQLFMHRVIMQTPKGFDTDHADGNRLNNQKENLRVCSHSSNMKNRKKNSNNSSGYKGVLWEPRKNYWYAKITSNGVLFYLGGGFKTPEEAARVYDEKAKELHGEFARLNFPEDSSNQKEEVNNDL